MLSTPIGLAVALAIQGDPPAGGGMTITRVSFLESSAAATSYAASNFTPNANSFLVAFVSVTACLLDGTMSGGGLTWSPVTSTNWGATSQHNLVMFTAEVGGSPASTTPTFDCTGDAGSACLIQVFEVTGLNATEVDETNVGAGASGAPAAAFASGDTNDLVLAAFASTNSNPTGATAPTGWGDYDELNQTLPTCAMGTAWKNTGESGTAIAFTGTGQSDWGCIVVSLNPA